MNHGFASGGRHRIRRVAMRIATGSLIAAASFSGAALAQELKSIDPSLPASEPAAQPTPAPAPSSSAVAKKDVLDGRFYIAPMFTYLLADGDRRTDDGLGGTLAFGKGIADNAALELTGRYLQADSEIDGDSATLYGYGASILVFPRHSLPNAYGIVTATYNEAEDHPGLVHDYDGVGFEAGLGYLLPIQFLGTGSALRLEAKFSLDSHNEDRVGAGGRNEFYDSVFNAGLFLPLGPEPKAAKPAPEPIVVVPVPPPADSDGDGVTDDLDRCPGTPRGTKVDATGCAVKPPCEQPAAGQPMDLSGCAVGDVLVLHGVTFEFDKARLTPNAKTILDSVVEALKTVASIKVVVAGHTDSKGSDEYNIKLSERRAASVREYLTERGIDPARLSSQGYGESEPVASNETDEGRELNRRVELRIQ